MIIRVLKRYIPKRNLSFYIFQRNSALFVENINLCFHQFCKTLNPCHTSLELLCKFNNTANGSQKCSYVHGICNQICRSNQPFNHKNATRHNHNHIHQSIKNADSILKSCHILISMAFNLQEFLIILIKFLNLHVFICKSPYYLIT